MSLKMNRLNFSKILLPFTFKSFCSQTYYLEEFESLVDELLFRLNALSNSLHHTLPPKAHHCREDSPVISLLQEPSNMDSQVRRKRHRHMHTVYPSIEYEHTWYSI